MSAAPDRAKTYERLCDLFLRHGWLSLEQLTRAAGADALDVHDALRELVKRGVVEVYRSRRRYSDTVLYRLKVAEPEPARLQVLPVVSLADCVRLQFKCPACGWRRTGRYHKTPWHDGSLHDACGRCGLEGGIDCFGLVDQVTA